MTPHDNSTGARELAAARRSGRALYAVLFVFSFFVNLLMLTGPLYMLQVYDRVLGSRSEATLVALSMLMVAMFVAMGFLDHARNQIVARVGARFQDALDKRVFQAAVRRLTVAPHDASASVAQRDLDSVQRYLSSPVHLAVFDLPWTPLFFAAIFVFHPLLGWLSLGGALCLIGLTVLNRSLTQAPLMQANRTADIADRLGENLKSETETVLALGMAGAGFARWNGARKAALAAAIAAADLGGVFAVASKTFRL